MLYRFPPDHSDWTETDKALWLVAQYWPYVSRPVARSVAEQVQIERMAEDQLRSEGCDPQKAICAWFPEPGGLRKVMIKAPPLHHGAAKTQ